MNAVDLATRPAVPAERDPVTRAIPEARLPTNLGPYSDAIAQYEAAYEALSQGAKNRLDYCDDCQKRAAYVPMSTLSGEPMRCCSECARDLVRRELAEPEALP